MKNEELLSIIDEDWVGFSASKVIGASVVWSDGSIGFSNVNNEADKDILDNYAYLLKETPGFKDVAFNISDHKMLVAERYGGEGITVNGGGGRCGNVDGYQLKGIGANCMVGEHDEVVHKYGGLDAPLAIIETIYTDLLCMLLPMGAVKIRALIYLGGKTAFYHHPANECWGIIMVRDGCVRPGHFMRAPYFRPQQQYQSMLIDDEHRTRKLNKKLFTLFGDSNQFVLFLGKFLQNCASQLGFARAARVMHGTLTPSNITIEGKWLDLPIVSMLGGGVNYCLTSQFYTEHHAPLNYAIELLNGYAKYNKTLLNPAPLVNYYNEQFDAYFRHYIGYVLGFDLELVKELDQDNWKVVADAFAKVIHSGTRFDNRPIARDPQDPVHSLIAGLFLSLSSPQAAEQCWVAAKVDASECQKLVASFNHIVLQLWNAETKENRGSLKSFVVATSLRALKRAYLSEVFYSPLIADTVWKLCQEKTPADIAPLINSYHELAAWIFEPVEESVVLYQSKNINMSYCQLSGEYRIDTQGALMRFLSYEELSLQLSNSNLCLDTNQFSFSYYFDRMLEILPSIESYKEAA